MVGNVHKTVPSLSKAFKPSEKVFVTISSNPSPSRSPQAGLEGSIPKNEILQSMVPSVPLRAYSVVFPLSDICPFIITSFSGYALETLHIAGEAHRRFTISKPKFVLHFAVGDNIPPANT